MIAWYSRGFTSIEADDQKASREFPKIFLPIHSNIWVPSQASTELEDTVPALKGLGADKSTTGRENCYNSENEPGSVKRETFSRVPIIIVIFLFLLQTQHLQLNRNTTVFSLKRGNLSSSHPHLLNYKVFM